MPDKDDFFLADGFVIYGLSPNRKTFAHNIKNELLRQGKRVFAVNRPGQAGYTDLKELNNHVDRAIIAMKPKNTVSVIDDLASADIHKVFLQQGSYDKEVLAQFADSGFDVYTGCAMMYMADAPFIHRFHRFFYELFGGSK
jgi:predicted CoA-binding protein